MYTKDKNVFHEFIQSGAYKGMMFQEYLKMRLKGLS
jgi:hypothetical protein